MMRARGFRGFRLGQRDAVLSGRAAPGKLTCRASLAADGAAPLCAKPAAWLLTAACAHEHIVPTLSCDGHAESCRREYTQRKVTCKECRRSVEPHSCPVVIDFAALPPSRRAA